METCWIRHIKPDPCPEQLLWLIERTPGCPLALAPRDVMGAPPLHSGTAAIRETVENPHGWLCCWVTMGL